MRTAKAVLASTLSLALVAPSASAVQIVVGSVASAPRAGTPTVLAPSPVATNAATPSFSVRNSVAFSPVRTPDSVLPRSAFASFVAPSVSLPGTVPSVVATKTPSTVSAAVAPSAPAAEIFREAKPSDSPVATRSSWDRFFSGTSARAALDAPEASAVAAPATSRSTPRPARARVGLYAAGAAAVPALHGFAAAVAHASPYLEAGAVLAGTYFANRGVHAILGKFAAKRGLDRHQIAVIRLVSSVVLWTAATAGALMLGGASHEMLTTVFGAGGTILTLGLRDVLGNWIQGVNFLITRPYAIGARVQIDDQPGTVADINMTGVLIKKDDGSDVKVRHTTLASKPVIVFGAYQFPDNSLHLSVPAKPKFQGVFGAVWKSLDRGFWLSTAAFAVLLITPAFVSALAAGWPATVIHYALAGSILWLTRRVETALAAAVDKLAEQNGWRPETKVVARLALRMALWMLGGGAAMRLFGVSWTALGASVGLTTLGVGLASNNFFGTVIQGGEVLFSKPFKVGDRLQVAHFDGVVEDMTLYHVVIKLDEGRHALVPYAVVRDATLVVTPGTPNK